MDVTGTAPYRVQFPKKITKIRRKSMTQEIEYACKPHHINSIGAHFYDLSNKANDHRPKNGWR